MVSLDSAGAEQRELLSKGFGEAGMKKEKEELRFKKAWSWPKKVEDFFKENIKEQYSCHLFCGNSELGDVRVDIETDKATHKEDILKGLSFEDNTFDVVFGDPPWKMPYHLRSKVMYEMRRICKIQGVIILNANWTPNKLKGCLLLEPFYISTARMPFANAAMIFRYLKLSNITEENLKNEFRI